MQQTQQQHTTVTEDDRNFSVTVRQDDDTGRWRPSISENGWEWEGDIPDFATAGEALTWARRMIVEQVQEDATSNTQNCPTCDGRGYESFGPLNISCPACSGTGIVSADHDNDDDDENDDDENDDEPGYNYPLVYLDGDIVTQADGRELSPDDELERVQVSFPTKENGEQTEADTNAALGWINSAAITLDRGDDAVTLSISVGDPRGAFTLTVRRLPDGRLVMHVPFPGESFAHRPLKQLREGTYEIE